MLYRYYQSELRAARSVTLALQATMNGIPNFEQWYQRARAELKAAPLAPFFAEIRNNSIHRGLNALNRITLEHLHEDLFNQMHRRERSHILVLPDLHSDHSTVLADAGQTSKLYVTSLLTVVFDCYERFKCVVDPQWYFTADNFSAMGKTFEDAISELGFPPGWASCAPSAEDGWRALRSQQPACQINHLFRKYIGSEILRPDVGGAAPSDERSPS